MIDRQRKELCYNCDEKFVKGHNCKEQKLFHMDMLSPPTSKEVTPEDPQEEDDQDQPQPKLKTKSQEDAQKEDIISLHALSRISSL